MGCFHSIINFRNAIQTSPGILEGMQETFVFQNIHNFSRWLSEQVLLENTSYDEHKFISKQDLHCIRSLVMHREIASNLLHPDDPANVLTPFKQPITVHIHDTQKDEVRKFEILYWNGSEEGQCSGFKIKNWSSNKTNYYQYFPTQYNSNIKWQWVCALL